MVPSMVALERSPLSSDPQARRIESADEARREDALRVRHLQEVLQRARPPFDDKSMAWWERHGNDKLTPPPLNLRLVAKLARRIEKSWSTDFPEPSLACAIYFRGVRVEVLGNLLRALRKFADDELVTFTVINRHWRFTPDELATLSAATLKAQFQSHLKQVGITTMPGLLAAFLHGEFEPYTGLYQLHFHGITTKEKGKALDRLKKRFGYEKTATGARPIVCKPVRKRERQVTYLLKAYWPERAVREVRGVLKRDRNAKRIKEPFHTQVLMFLDRHRLIELTVMNNCWSNRIGGTRAMRRFYLSVTGR